MKTEELMPYLAKFVSVTMDDGAVVSGYIANRDAIREGTAKNAEIVNGLQNSSAAIARMVSVEVVSREDTTSIPILDQKGTEKLKRKQQEVFSDRLDELFEDSLSDDLEVKLPDGRVISSRKK